jgi:hypothetical protein
MVVMATADQEIRVTTNRQLIGTNTFVVFLAIVLLGVQATAQPCVPQVDGFVSLSGMLRRETHPSHEPYRPPRMFYLEFDPPICVMGVVDIDGGGAQGDEHDVRLVGIAESVRGMYARLTDHVGHRVVVTGRPAIPHSGGLGSFCLFEWTLGDRRPPVEEQEQRDAGRAQDDGEPQAQRTPLQRSVGNAQGRDVALTRRELPRCSPRSRPARHFSDRDIVAAQSNLRALADASSELSDVLQLENDRTGLALWDRRWYRRLSRMVSWVCTASARAFVIPERFRSADDNAIAEALRAMSNYQGDLTWNSFVHALWRYRAEGNVASLGDYRLALDIAIRAVN